MPIWEIRDANGNTHSVDLAKANLKSVNDIEDLVKNEFKKFDEKKKKTKVSKAGQKRVSKKIGYLIGKEKMDPKQAAAIAYSMEEEGDLDEISAMGAGSVEGYAGPRKKKKKQDILVREILNYLEKSAIMEK